MKSTVPFFDIDKSDAPYNGWAELKLSDSILAAQLRLIDLKEELVRDFDRFAETGESEAYEYYKSSVRSIIRYSVEGKRFVKEMAQCLIRYDNEFTSFYITPPYLIFHLPDDENEGAGSVHSDTVTGYSPMFTCWTPINAGQLQYSPVTLFEGSQIATEAGTNGFFEKVVAKLRRGNAESDPVVGNRYELTPDKSSSYLWESSLQHCGNKNTGLTAHCAAVIRITALPLYSEPSLSCGEIVKQSIIDEPAVSLSDLAAALAEASEFIAETPDFTVCDESTAALLKQVYAAKNKLSERMQKHVSFSFALIAQRTSDKPKSIAFDLLSYVYGKENLVGLERLLKYCKKYKTHAKMYNLLNKYNSFDSYQEYTLLQRFGGLASPEDAIRHDQPARVIPW